MVQVGTAGDTEESKGEMEEALLPLAKEQSPGAAGMVSLSLEPMDSMWLWRCSDFRLLAPALSGCAVHRFYFKPPTWTVCHGAA